MGREPKTADRLAGALDLVSAERIGARVDELGAIGGEPTGGVTRLALTPAEKQAAELVAGWLRPLGYGCRQDGAGNLFASRSPASRILVGSHLDTVPAGGRYDGALGVIAAVELAQTAHDAGLKLPVEIVGWSGEEGVRFGVPLFGSAAAFGLLPEPAWDRPDAGGRTAREAAQELLGGPGTRPPPARYDHGSPHAYLELHIEQAETLADAGRPLGVVARIIGATHTAITITGAANHAGTTPLAERRDALAAAAECILAVEAVARAKPGTLIATVGELVAFPGAKNVVAGACTFTLDIRAPEDTDRSAGHREIRHAVDRICRDRGVRWTEELLSEYAATPMGDVVAGALGAGCRELGVDAPPMVSWAVHDAQPCAWAGIPTGMLFVRSTGGSHNPAESASGADCAAGVRALLFAIATLLGLTAVD